MKKNKKEILNGDKAPVVRSADFDKFLETCIEVHKEHDLAYTFWYNEIHCFGRVTIVPRHICLDIMPSNIRDNIGNGCGMMVSKMFDRND